MPSKNREKFEAIWFVGYAIKESKSYKSSWVFGYAYVGEECKKILTDSGGVQKEAYIFNLI